MAGWRGIKESLRGREDLGRCWIRGRDEMKLNAKVK